MNASARSRGGESASNPDVFWAGPGHSLGWVPGHHVYDTASDMLSGLEHVFHILDLRPFRKRVRSLLGGGPCLLLDAGRDPARDYATRVVSSDDATVPPHVWPEGWEPMYSLCVSLAVMERVLASLPDVDLARVSFFGPRNPFSVAAADEPTIVMPFDTCAYRHMGDGGRYWEDGQEHVCPARDCAMGRMYGWEWSPPTPPRHEPMERGTPEAPLVHRFHHDGRP